MNKSTAARPIAELDVHELQKVIDTHTDLRMWQSVTVKGSSAGVEAAARALAKLPEVTALEAIEAATCHMELTGGRRWIDVMYAREHGDTWDAIGNAMHMSADEARAWYAAKIAHQARYVGDLHDAARAEAAL